MSAEIIFQLVSRDAYSSSPLKWWRRWRMTKHEQRFNHEIAFRLAYDKRDGDLGEA
jgi:hypothetical protein